eukprot:UN03078
MRAILRNESKYYLQNDKKYYLQKNGVLLSGWFHKFFCRFREKPAFYYPGELLSGLR